MSVLPEVPFLRITQIIGDRKAGITPLIPISRAGWWNGVKSGIYPQPVKLSERVTAWRTQDIRDLIEKINSQVA